MNIQHFADGEFSVSYEESIRGRDVFLVQSTFPNSDNLMELLLMIDAAKRASAHSIIAVVPYFGWARQDRKDKPRVSIGAKLIADMLSTAGINRLITMDLHADQIQGFFNVPVDHLYASSVFLEYIKSSLPLDNLCIATPDVGGTKRASSYSKYLGVPMVICHKSRLRANEVAEMRIIGDVKGLDVLLVDDMVDTAGTIIGARYRQPRRDVRPRFHSCGSVRLDGDDLYGFHPLREEMRESEDPFHRRYVRRGDPSCMQWRVYQLAVCDLMVSYLI